MGGKRRPRLVGGDIFDHDDGPAALTKVRRCGLRGEERSLGSGSESRVPVRLGDVGDRFGHETPAGRVHQQIETAELVDGTGHERLGRLYVGEISVGLPGGQHRPVLRAQPTGTRQDEDAGGALDRVRAPQKDWNAEQDSLLGEVPDEVVTKRTGRSVTAVESRRKKLGVGRHEREI